MSHKGGPPAWQQRRDSPPYEEYDVYGNPALPTESKKEKRRRDMVDRVSRLHGAASPRLCSALLARDRGLMCVSLAADTLERRDR